MLYFLILCIQLTEDNVLGSVEYCKKLRQIEPKKTMAKHVLKKRVGKLSNWSEILILGNKLFQFCLLFGNNLKYFIEIFSEFKRINSLF